MRIYTFIAKTSKVLAYTFVVLLLLLVLKNHNNFGVIVVPLFVILLVKCM